MLKILGVLTLIWVIVVVWHYCRVKICLSGGFSKIWLNRDFDIDLEELSKRKQMNSSNAVLTQSRSHKKRSCAGVKEDRDLSIHIGKVAVALEKITENQLNMSNLYEVMNIEGFDGYACFSI